MPPIPSPSDAHLRHFESLLDEYGARVNRLARRFAMSESDAEDLTQEIFLDIFKALPSFRGEAAVSTWIYRIALNHCLRFQSKSRKEAELRAPEALSETLSETTPEPTPDPSRRVASRELSQQVQNAVGRLPEHHKSVVILHELHGFTYAQCAQILDVPVGTVKSRLSNAFRALRGTLASYVLSETPEIKPGDSKSSRTSSAKVVAGSP